MSANRYGWGMPPSIQERASRHADITAKEVDRWIRETLLLYDVCVRIGGSHDASSEILEELSEDISKKYGVYLRHQELHRAETTLVIASVIVKKIRVILARS